MAKLIFSVVFYCTFIAIGQSNIRAKQHNQTSIQTILDDATAYKVCESPWQYRDNGHCLCGKQTPHDIVKCENHKNLTALACFCVTFNDEEGVTELGNCIYKCGNPMVF